MLLSGKSLLSRGEKKIRAKCFKFWGFFKLGVRSKAAQFLLTVVFLFQGKADNCVQLSDLTLQLVPVSPGHGRNFRNTLGASQQRGAGAPALLGEAGKALPMEPCLRLPPGAQLSSAPAFLKEKLLWLGGIHPSPQDTMNPRGEGLWWCSQGS